MTDAPIVPPLHGLLTDVLENRFGPIQVVVVHQDMEHRVADLNDKDGRTLVRAITTWFWTPGSPVSPLLEKLQDASGSIGEVAKQLGYDISRRIIDCKTVDIPTNLAERFRTSEPKARAYTSELIATKEGIGALFAVVTEMFSPNITSPEIKHAEAITRSPRTITQQEYARHQLSVESLIK